MSGIKHFDLEEFACTHTGKNLIQPAFVYRLDRLREACGFPFVITSGYRDRTHPVEAAKERPGRHNMGIAADISVTTSYRRHVLLTEALAAGFTGIGIGKDFVHLDIRSGNPACWVY